MKTLISPTQSTNNLTSFGNETPLRSKSSSEVTKHLIFFNFKIIIINKRFKGKKLEMVTSCSRKSIWMSWMSKITFSVKTQCWWKFGKLLDFWLRPTWLNQQVSRSFHASHSVSTIQLWGVDTDHFLVTFWKMTPLGVVCLSWEGGNNWNYRDSLYSGVGESSQI